MATLWGNTVLRSDTDRVRKEDEIEEKIKRQQKELYDKIVNASKIISLSKKSSSTYIVTNSKIADIINKKI